MDPAALRDDMVDGLAHESKGVLDTERVARALRAVPRHEFVEASPERAYVDSPLERRGSTVLAPRTVARLVEALDPRPDDDVLVVGAGVGYTAAVLAEIAGARHVHAVDIERSLVLEARRNLRQAGYGEVLVDCRDGADGLPEYAPYDAVLVEAAAVEVPATVEDQLAPDGRLVMPLGGPAQTLVAVAAGGGRTEHGPVSFDPLLVEGEQPGAVERNRTAREDRERAAQEAQRRPGWEHDWIEWDDV